MDGNRGIGADLHQRRAPATPPRAIRARPLKTSPSPSPSPPRFVGTPFPSLSRPTSTPSLSSPLCSPLSSRPLSTPSPPRSTSTPSPPKAGGASPPPPAPSRSRSSHSASPSAARRASPSRRVKFVDDHLHDRNGSDIETPASSLFVPETLVRRRSAPCDLKVDDAQTRRGELISAASFRDIAKFKRDYFQNQLR